MCLIPERQLKGEQQARKIIEKFLVDHGALYEVQEYDTFIPRYKKWNLLVDGKKIESLPCGYVSGKITGKDTILSSLISSQKNLYDTNINFNPSCKKISRSNHYFAPALAINRKDVGKVVMADTVLGEMVVEKKKHRSANILVGNLKNPKRIIFSHYDSVSTGAVDNASGTALSCDLIISQPELLKENLFALCGNEELSYDEPIYWGHGYREFELKYPKLLKSAKEILILDSFGHTKPQKITSVPVMTLAFPITAIEVYAPKMTVVAGSLNKLMDFYHAENDTPKEITPAYYVEAMKLVQKLMKR